MEIKKYFLFCLLGLFLSQTNAQKLIEDGQETIPVLVLKQEKKGEVKMLSIGAGIQYKLIGNKTKFKGKITQISSDSLWVDNKGENLENYTMIRGKIRSDMQILGGGLLGLGAATTVFGTALIGSTPGLIIAASGLSALAVGTVFVSSKKKFIREKGWTFHQGSIQYKK